MWEELVSRRKETVERTAGWQSAGWQSAGWQSAGWQSAGWQSAGTPGSEDSES